MCKATFLVFDENTLDQHYAYDLHRFDRVWNKTGASLNH